MCVLALGSPDTIAFAAPLFRDTEIVPPTGESHEASWLPACVTMIDGTTVFPTPPVSVVHADAAGAKPSTAMTTASERTFLTMPGEPPSFKHCGRC